MKKIDDILHNLFSNKNFLEQQCFNRLLKALPHTTRQMVSHIYRRDRVLYFVLTHPGYQIEFNYSKKLINDILNRLKEIDGRCKALQIDEIKAYAKFIPQTKPKKRGLQTYKERASGEFEIETKNPDIEEIFQKIKEAIRKNGTDR